MCLVGFWDAIPYIQGFRDLLLISSDCLTVLLPSLFIILYFSLLSCLAPSKRGRARMERKRTTMGEAAQIRCKSALPPQVYIPPIATLWWQLPVCPPQWHCLTKIKTKAIWGGCPLLASTQMRVIRCYPPARSDPC